MNHRLEVWGVTGIPEVAAGDDLTTLIAAAQPDLADGDVLVVTSKVVSKAEGRLRAMDREAAIDAETVRVVAARGPTRIVETRHGFVLAAAGVDASNVAPGTVALLPVDADASARRLRAGLRERLGIEIGVVVSDTFGRPWRNGLTDVAVGVAGVPALEDHRGRVDRYGNSLAMTVTCLADELAAAADLVKGKLAGVPVAVVRGLGIVTSDDGSGVRPVVRTPAEDMFRLGTREAVQAAVGGSSEPTGPPADVQAALRAALPMAAPGRLVVQESADGYRLLCCVPAAAGDDQLVELGVAVERVRLHLAAAGVASQWVSGSLPDTDVPDGLRGVGCLRVGAPTGAS